MMKIDCSRQTWTRRTDIHQRFLSSCQSQKTNCAFYNPFLSTLGSYLHIYNANIQGHGVVLDDQGQGYQQRTTFSSGSRQVSMSEREVSCTCPETMSFYQ